LKLQYHKLLLNFPLNFNLRRYKVGESEAALKGVFAAAAAAAPCVVLLDELDALAPARGGGDGLGGRGAESGGGGGGDEAMSARVVAALLVGPARYCSPRHRMQLNSRNEGSTAVDEMVGIGPGRYCSS
jgi:SpoVK/Ycf46/Vps4 family AAA+-type ATPase